jgi:hypothetical protein
MGPCPLPHTPSPNPITIFQGPASRGESPTLPVFWFPSSRLGTQVHAKLCLAPHSAHQNGGRDVCATCLFLILRKPGAHERLSEKVFVLLIPRPHL